MSPGAQAVRGARDDEGWRVAHLPRLVLPVWLHLLEVRRYLEELQGRNRLLHRGHDIYII